MRIQHNIPAMSAYRNYSNNVSAVSKNLERLSSGYKINRAGDDAAGLAISEKMRAQISGLEQAQSNAKSGINLVQTAEGALTEVHDMLNRMVTLAEQSANGTYDDSVDRVQLQKEVVQLRDEINRIADSANFNGIKLLDGSMDSSITASETLKLDNLTAASTSMILPGVEKMIAKDQAAGTSSTTSTSGTSAANGAAGTETKAPVKTQFAIDLNDLDITWDEASTNTDTVRFEINFGRATGAPDVGGGKKNILLAFDFDKDKAASAFDSDGKLNVSKLSKLLADDIAGSGAANLDSDGYWKGRLDIAGACTGTTDADRTNSYSGFDVKVDADTNQILFKLHDIDKATEAEMNLNWNDINNGINFNVMTKDATGATTTKIASDSVSIDPESRVNGWKDGMKDPTGVIGTNTIVYNNVGETSKTNFFVDLKNLNLDIDLSKIDDEDKILLKFDMGTMYTDANGNPKRSILGIQLDGDDLKAAYEEDSTGKQVLNTEKLLQAIQADLDTATDADGNKGIVRVDVAGVCDQREPDGGYSGFDVKTEGTGLRFELHDVNMAHPDEAKANWGDITVSLWRDPGKTAASGSDYTEQIWGGGSKGQWGVGTSDMHDGVLPGQNTFANTVLDMKQTGFDVNDASKNDGYTISADGKTFVLAVGDDSAVAKADLGDSGAIVVKVGKNASVDKQLQELANAMNKACSTWEVGATDKGSTAFYGLTFSQHVKGAKATDMAGNDLTTVEGIAKAFSYGKADVKSVTAGKALTLQIGDTSESFNQLQVNVKDMHADAMGIGDIDIGTQQGASDAMQKIKDAINYVSDVRGDLGATQNRLDHTINNLSVMQENIQDAESTIRDVDVAKEMMEYTKNNILVQSAQAMLAQANQLPQGVLQLLG